MEMTTHIRLAGSPLKERAHICAFLHRSEELQHLLLPFIKEGLDLGEKALHTVDPRQREAHIRWLRSAGMDVDSAHNNRQVEVLDWTESHLRDGRFDQEWTLAFWPKVASDAKKNGFPRVRFVSQMEWALEADLDMTELLEYEAKANDAWLRQDSPVNPAICIYDLTRFRGDIVVDVMRTHPLIIIGGVLQENPFFVPPKEFLLEIRQRRARHSASALTAG